MPYKIENDLQVLLREQELIESSESFIHELDDLFRQNITLPSYQSDQTVMRGLRYPNGTGVIAGVTAVGDVNGYDLIDGKKFPERGGCFIAASTFRKLSNNSFLKAASDSKKSYIFFYLVVFPMLHS